MRLPRDVSASDLIKALKNLRYKVTWQKDCHIRVTTQLGGEHHEVIPSHSPIKIGTLSGILKNIAYHHQMTVSDLISLLKF